MPCRPQNTGKKVLIQRQLCVLVSFFYTWLTSFLSTACWKDCLFSIIYILPHLLKIAVHRCMDLSPGFIYCFIDLYFYFCASTILSWWLYYSIYLTCLLRNLYAGQEATVRTGHGTTDWVRQGCILSPCLFNFYAEYILRNAGLEVK